MCPPGGAGRQGATAYHLYYWRYPDAGYGGNFHRWAQSGERRPYQSWGNSSAMRAGSVGWAFATLEETLAEARRSAEVTYDHPEGIQAADDDPCLSSPDHAGPSSPRDPSPTGQTSAQQQGLTRPALSTCGRPRTNFLSLFLRTSHVSDHRSGRQSIRPR